jgi:DNA-directed RNA polymerase specialized sigma24 family protein
MPPAGSRDIVRLTPYLRRYARALVGSQADGDDFVHAALESLVRAGGGLDRDVPVNVWMFRAFHRIWRKSLNGHSIDAGNRSVVDARLGRLTPEHRTALLLIAMEGFTEMEAAQILEVPLETVEDRFDAAARDIDTQLATDVLIIEDEPIVALDLARLVGELGHRVVGMAATQTEAAALARDLSLGLVLADVRLADGSSGLDAPSDILADFDIPVIFITAFPERLLTGEGEEPTFLITKPFREEAVKALVGQALFFHQPAVVAATGANP